MAAKHLDIFNDELTKRRNRMDEKRSATLEEVLPLVEDTPAPVRVRAAFRRKGNSSQELIWGTAGVCPSCGAYAGHLWFTTLVSGIHDEQTKKTVRHEIKGSQGQLNVSRCLSCDALACWLKTPLARHDPIRGQVRTSRTKLVYPLPGIRVPPADGLQPEETDLYEEAAAVAPTSRRAASALLRVLLEAFLKRHLTTAGQSVGSKNLYQLIDLTVTYLDLSPTLKTGLTAIRKRGNASVHDPYGLTDAEQAEDLPWLFRAIDDLVDELHVKPAKWSAIAKT